VQPNQDPNSRFIITNSRPGMELCSDEGTCWNGLERRRELIALEKRIFERIDAQDHMMLQFHDDFVVHIAETKATKDLVNELLELYKGSKFMITAFKFFIPIVAGIAALYLWVKDHLK